MLAKSSKVAQESGAAKEDLDLNCEEDGLPVTLSLNRGLKIRMTLPKYMMECLMEEIKRSSRFSRILPPMSRSNIVLNALVVLSILLICIAVCRGGRTKGRCRECQSTVFADRQVDKIPDPNDGVGAKLLTNRILWRAIPIA
ncbi:hypothetical protein [Pelosinus fermentans]|uniref:hypothetical protein n=1 Tax=Pelosinus fermentans TaxID=365349 RepID=UPI00055A87DE|nr:hypothetical protein [Pelosinus fermentans]